MCIRDSFREEQFLIFRTSKGLVLYSGCAHTGIINAINFSKKLTGENKILGIVGGLHLKHDLTKIKKTIQQLKKIKPKFLLPNHCTGYVGIGKMIEEFGKSVILSPTGTFSTGECWRLV